MIEKTANFFWHGPLSLYEYSCINSFIKRGFITKVWSYQNLNLPRGAILCDANLIVDEKKLYSFTMDGREKNLAAFADYFRLTLLSKDGGWYFDADCFCLRDVDDFVSLISNNLFIAGYESDEFVNNAVMYSTSDYIKPILEQAEKISLEKENMFFWGEIGPSLLTSFLKNNKNNNKILERNLFYPIHYKEALSVIDVSQKENLEKKIAQSYTVHLWNEILRKNGIDKNIAPIKNSFLDKIFGVNNDH